MDKRYGDVEFIGKKGEIYVWGFPGVQGAGFLMELLD